MAQASVDVVKTKRSGQVERDGNGEKLAFDDIREEKLQSEKQVWNEQTKLNSFCDICFLLNYTKISAFFLCYLCKQYMCVECSERHDQSHRMVEIESERGEREIESKRGEREIESKGGEREIESKRGERETESKRGEREIESKRSERETESKRGEREIESKRSERETKRRSFLGAMRNESKIAREVMFNREDVSEVDRVGVKHELDKSDNYVITGLCGLDDTRWVICDYYNDCIKIFMIGSHILQRYIRFGSVIYSVTEIKVKLEPTEQGVMAASVSSGIKVKKVKPLKRLRAAINSFFSVKRESTEQSVMAASDISVPIQSKPDKQCLLAVTLPRERRILFINLTQNPAVITKSIKTKKHCLDIAFSGDQIVTLCTDEYLGYGDYGGYGRDGRYGPWFISLLSTGGDELKTINTPLGPSWDYPRLAVCPGRFYLTDWGNHKVLCMNNAGKVVSHKTIEWLNPRAISVDPDTDNVYISDWGNSTLYRLDSRLESFESLLEFNPVNTGWPDLLCVYRDRLYVSHGLLGSTHECIVTVVRVL